MILRKSCPVLGLKIKIAPLIGFVVKLPSKVWSKLNRLISFGSFQGHLERGVSIQFLFGDTLFSQAF